MPESCRDRPATAVEYVFLLAKSERYFYDGLAVRMAASGKSGGACFGKVGHLELASDAGQGARRHSKAERAKYDTGRSRRNSDWFFESWQGLYDEGDGPLAFVVNPAAYKDAHFATYPEALVEPCIAAGTSEKGCCPKCGKPWERMIQNAGTYTPVRGKSLKARARSVGQGEYRPNSKETGGVGTRGHTSVGWHPQCLCHEMKPVDEGTPYDPIPCTVLDPFCGSGTTLAVAAKLGRKSIGIEVNPEYVEMAKRRIGQAIQPNTYRDEAKDEAPLFTQEGDDAA